MERDPGPQDVLDVGRIAHGVGDGRGFLNSVQIVSIPEPSTGLLVLSGLAGLWFLKRKRPAG